jgi:hypothetical protein
LIEGEDSQRADLSSSWRVARRTGTWLAVLALFVQIAASFGHVHPRDFARTLSRTVDGWHKPTVANAAVSNPASLAEDQDQCPICFSSSLLATSFVPFAKQPNAVIKFGEVSYASVPAAFGLPRSGRASFQSRAPPSA